MTRPEGKSELVITPTGRNYSLDVLTASIRITAGTGATAAERTISVSQGANTKTYLTFLDEDLSGDNPIIQFPSALGGEPAVRKINISTNNALDIKVSSNQDIDITEGEGEDSQALTKVRLPDDYGWMSYEISEQVSEEGIVTVLTLTSDINPSTTETLKVAIDVVSGNDDINNDVVTRRIALVSLPSTPAIVINPSDLVFAYDAAEAQTVLCYLQCAVRDRCQLAGRYRYLVRISRDRTCGGGRPCECIFSEGAGICTGGRQGGKNRLYAV